MQHFALSLLVQVSLAARAPAPPAPAPAPAAETPAAETPAAEAPAATTSEPAPAEAPPAEKKSLLPPKTKPRLLVMDITDKGAGPEITNAVNQAVQAQAIASHNGEAITTTQIKLLLDAQATQQLVGCDSASCMTEIGTLIEADAIMGGNVTQVGDDVVITLLTVDPKDGRLMKQEQRKVPLNRDLYFYAAKQLGALLLTGKAADPRVPVVIKIFDGETAVEATIVVDGAEKGISSSTQVELDPGSHEIIVRRSGFSEWRTLVDIAEGTPQQVTAKLVTERVELWPVAIATGVADLAAGIFGGLMVDFAVNEYDGTGVFSDLWGKKDASGPGAPYTTAAPTDTADLCARESTIWFYAGRAPSGDDNNQCGTPAGPGVGGSLLIGAGVLTVVTGALITTDLILGAE